MFLKKLMMDLVEEPRGVAKLLGKIRRIFNGAYSSFTDPIFQFFDDWMLTPVEISAYMVCMGLFILLIYRRLPRRTKAQIRKQRRTQNSLKKSNVDKDHKDVH